MAHLLELSGTTEWHEPVADFTGILVLSPTEFERAVAGTLLPSAEPRPSFRRPAGHTRRTH